MNNINTLIKSTSIASIVAIGLKVVLYQYPIHSVSARLLLPFNAYIEMKPIKCVAINVHWINNNSTSYSFESRSISKKFATDCINKGIDFVHNQLNKKKINKEENYNNMISKKNKLLSQIESSNNLDQKTLNLIFEYNKFLSKLNRYEYYNSYILNNSINDRKLVFKEYIYKNSWRYSLVAFLLSFWLIFSSLEYLKNEK